MTGQGSLHLNRRECGYRNPEKEDSPSGTREKAERLPDVRPDMGKEAVRGDGNQSVSREGHAGAADHLRALKDSRDEAGLCGKVRTGTIALKGDKDSVQMKAGAWAHAMPDGVIRRDSGRKRAGQSSEANAGMIRRIGSGAGNRAFTASYPCAGSAGSDRWAL